MLSESLASGDSLAPPNDILPEPVARTFGCSFNFGSIQIKRPKRVLLEPWTHWVGTTAEATVELALSTPLEFTEVTT